MREQEAGHDKLFRQPPPFEAPDEHETGAFTHGHDDTEIVKVEGEGGAIAHPRSRTLFRQLLIAAATIVGIVLLYFLMGKLATLSDVHVRVPGVYDGEEVTGAIVCNHLAQETQKLSLIQLICGWVGILVGVVLVGGSTLFGTGKMTGDNPSIGDVIRAHKGFICGMIGIMSAAVGWQFIQRSTYSTRAASAATIAIGSIDSDAEDRAAYSKCVGAKAAWLEGRADQTELRRLTALVERSLSRPEKEEDMARRDSPALVEGVGTSPSVK